MKRRPAIGLVLTLAMLGATAANAADYVVQQDGTVVRRTKFESSCAVALARFCPELSEALGQTRNQVICLKPYRASLPQYCRSAVNAAMK